MNLNIFYGILIPFLGIHRCRLRILHEEYVK